MEKQARKRKLPSLVRWILWVLLVQFVLMNISAAFYARRLTHFYDDPALRENYQPSSNIFAKTWRLFSGPRQVRPVITATPTVPYDTVWLKTKKGLDIDGWYFKTDSLPKGTVILFHGVTVTKSSLLTEAYEFRFLGYNVLLIDFRGHGNSGGNTTTIGYRESEEVKLGYDYITGKGEKNIFLWGTSMGSVVIARAIGEYSLKPAGVILEMPFASLQSHLKARARTLGFPSQPFGMLVTFWIGIERGFNGFNHNTASYAKKINCPVLMQWGAADNLVLRWETDKIYNAIPSANKKLVVYDHAGHGSLCENQPLKWRIEVERFLRVSSQW